MTAENSPSEWQIRATILATIGFCAGGGIGSAMLTDELFFPDQHVYDEHSAEIHSLNSQLDEVLNAQETANQIGIDTTPFQQTASEIRQQIATETAALPEDYNPNIAELAESGASLLPTALVAAVLVYKLRRGMKQSKAPTATNSHSAVL